MLGRGRRARPRLGPAGALRGVKKRESRRSWENRIRESIRGAGSGALAFRIGNKESKSACARETDRNRRRPVADAAKRDGGFPVFAALFRKTAGRAQPTLTRRSSGWGLRRPESPQKFRSAAASAVAPRRSGRKSGRQMGSFATNREKVGLFAAPRCIRARKPIQ